MKRLKPAVLLLILVLIACIFRVNLNVRAPSGPNGAGTVKKSFVDEASEVPVTGMNRDEDRSVSIHGRKRECPIGISTTGSPVPSEQQEGTVQNREPEDNRLRRQLAMDVDRSESGRKTESEPVSRGVLESENGDSTVSGRKDQYDGTEQESSIRIVRISVAEQYAESTEIVMPKDSRPDSMAFSAGFYLEGNDVQIPCSLMLRTRDAEGKEFLQYLPWNPNHPNSFQALSPMRGYASIAVYEGPRLMGRFFVIELAGEETISLDLNAGQDRRLASL